jgi:hypothetical protein
MQLQKKYNILDVIFVYLSLLKQKNIFTGKNLSVESSHLSIHSFNLHCNRALPIWYVEIQLRFEIPTRAESLKSYIKHFGRF